MVKKMKKPKNKLSKNDKLNGLRAAVLGANDGLVSVAGLIFGVAGATNSKATIFTAGLAGLVAGAISMGLGEFVSVSTQRDTERVFIAREKHLLKTEPAHELEDLARHFVTKGVSYPTALQFAREVTADDPLKAHLEAEFGLNEENLTNPIIAAIASIASFTLGGLIPLVCTVLAPDDLRIRLTLIAVLAGLFLTGYYSAKAGGASRRKAILRVVIGGVVAMGVTYVVGHVFGTVIG